MREKETKIDRQTDRHTHVERHYILVYKWIDRERESLDI